MAKDWFRVRVRVRVRVRFRVRVRVSVSRPDHLRRVLAEIR